MFSNSKYFSSNHTGGGVSTQSIEQINGLQPIVDLDATIANSYTSGTVWNNIVANPDDGSNTEDHHFDLQGNPTFTGSPDSSSAYFDMDGAGDYFEITGGTNSAFFRDMHKDSNSWGINFCLQTTSPLTSTPFFETGYLGAENGLWMFGNSSGTLIGRRYTNGANQQFSRASMFSAATNYFVSITATMENEGGQLTFYSAVNSRTYTTTPVGSITSNTNDASVATQLFRAADIVLSNGARVYAFSATNKKQTNDDLSALADLYNERHNRTYV